MRRRLVAAPVAVGVMLVGTLTLVPGTAKASVTAGLGLGDAEEAAASQQIDEARDEGETANKLLTTAATDAVLPSEPPAGSMMNNDQGTDGAPSATLPGSESEQNGLSEGSLIDAGVSGKEDSGKLDQANGQVADDNLTGKDEGDLLAVDPNSNDQTASPEDNVESAFGGESEPDLAGNADSVVAGIVESENSALSDNELASDELQPTQSKAAALSESAVVTDTVAKKVATVQTYRLYNPNSGEHFYTQSNVEKNHLISVGWRYEGIGWTAVAASNTPVYRLYNPYAGDHHYTTSLVERNHLVDVGWRYEGIGWYSDDNKGVALYREYNPNATSGAHHFTSSVLERLNVISAGWRYEGIAWYGVDLGPVAPTNAKPNTWVDNGGSRFYIGSNGTAVTGWQTIGGTKYHFDSKGRMSTGVTDVGGTIYSFSSKGTLNTAWQKLSGYWYYFDKSSGALRRDGWFVDGGKTYYLDPTSGAMATGKRWIDGYLRPFDSSGACLKTGYQTKWGNLMLAARNVTLPSYTRGSYWSYVHPCTIGANATRAQVIEAFINAAYDYQRAHTRWVDNNCGAPGTTVDCSGLVMESLYAVGMDLTGVAGGDFNPYSKYYWNHHFANTWRQNNTFQPISFGQLERGDIVYYSGHVAIYLGGGRILESTPYASNVREASVYSPGAILGCARPFTK